MRLTTQVSRNEESGFLELERITLILTKLDQ